MTPTNDPRASAAAKEIEQACHLLQHTPEHIMIPIIAKHFEGDADELRKLKSGENVLLPVSTAHAQVMASVALQYLGKGDALRTAAEKLIQFYDTFDADAENKQSSEGQKLITALRDALKMKE